MRPLSVSLALLGSLHLSALPASGANSIFIESRLVRACDTNVSLGLYFTTDQAYEAMIVPLMIRNLTGEAFIANHLSFVSGGPRMDTLKTMGAFETQQTHAVAGQYYGRHTCEGDDSGHTWAPDQGGADFTSPDAASYVIAAKQVLMPYTSGSDGVPGAGVPSLTLNFDVNCEGGTFEIDTTCIAPNNHLLLIGGESYEILVVPAFTKGIIEICPPETLSGQITVSDSLKFDVHFSGSVSVASGVTLTVMPTARVTASDGSILSVYGSLVFDTSGPGRPVFGCDSAGSDVWGGILIADGASVDWGHGCVIEDATNAVRIIDGATSTDVGYVTVADPVSKGFEISESSVRLVDDTIRASGATYGVYLLASDPVVNSLMISGCETGIYAVGSSGEIQGTVIEAPGEYGIRVITDAENPGDDTLRLIDNQVLGHFSGAHLRADPLGHCRIDSCVFATSVIDSLQSHYGIHADEGAWVYMRGSLILNCDTALYSYGSAADFGYGASSGDNAIYNDSCAGSCPGTKLVAVMAFDFMEESGDGEQTDGGGPPPPLYLVNAEGNWWGSSSPSLSWFTAVDYTPYLSEDPLGKLAVWADGRVAGGRMPEFGISNYPNPFNSATEIEFTLTASERVKLEVYNVLGQVVKTLSDREYSEGTHRVSWDATDKNGNRVASGVYLYRFTAGDQTITKKMLLLK